MTWRELVRGVRTATVLVGLCVAVGAAGCGGGSHATTNAQSGLPAEETAADLGPGIQMDLQARAMV